MQLWIMEYSEGISYVKRWDAGACISQNEVTDVWFAHKRFVLTWSDNLWLDWHSYLITKMECEMYL